MQSWSLENLKRLREVKDLYRAGRQLSIKLEQPSKEEMLEMQPPPQKKQHLGGAAASSTSAAKPSVDVVDITSDSE